MSGVLLALGARRHVPETCVSHVPIVAPPSAVAASLALADENTAGGGGGGGGDEKTRRSSTAKSHRWAGRW